MAAYTPMARLRAGPSGKVTAISDSAVGRGERAADALDHPRGEQPGLGGGEPAGQRGQPRTAAMPKMKIAAAAEQVTGPAAEQQQAAERERVGVDDPFQAGAGKVQRVLDVRQGHVHDRAYSGVDERHLP